MAGEIRDALARMREREQAAGLAGEQAIEDAEGTIRLLFSGFDLDMGSDEFREVLTEYAGIAAAALTDGADPVMVGVTHFADGFLLGLLVAEARQREGVRG